MTRHEIDGVRARVVAPGGPLVVLAEVARPAYEAVHGTERVHGLTYTQERGDSFQWVGLAEWAAHTSVPGSAPDGPRAALVAFAAQKHAAAFRAGNDLKDVAARLRHADGRWLDPDTAEAQYQRIDRILSSPETVLPSHRYDEPVDADGAPVTEARETAAAYSAEAHLNEFVSSWENPGGRVVLYTESAARAAADAPKPQWFVSHGSLADARSFARSIVGSESWDRHALNVDDLHVVTGDKRRRAAAWSDSGKISLPIDSRTNLIVVHEVAHAARYGPDGFYRGSPHGKDWRNAHVDVLDEHVSPEAADVVCRGYVLNRLPLRGDLWARGVVQCATFWSQGRFAGDDKVLVTPDGPYRYAVARSDAEGGIVLDGNVPVRRDDLERSDVRNLRFSPAAAREYGSAPRAGEGFGPAVPTARIGPSFG